MSRLIPLTFLWVGLGVFFLPLYAADTTRSVNPQDYAPYPAPAPGYVTDFASVVSADDKGYLNRMIYQTEKKTGVEMAVLTIGSISDYPAGASGIEEFAAGVFNKWSIGNLPGNNGVLLLVAVKDRKVRIELGAGYGHTKDSQARSIVDRVMVPAFKKGEFSHGIRNGCAAIAAEFAGVRWTFAWSVVVLPVLIVMLIFLAISLFRSGKRGWGWVVVGFIIMLLIALLKVLIGLGRAFRESTRGTRGPGGFGGGYGGGSSGGGGATGSW